MESTQDLGQVLDIAVAQQNIIDIAKELARQSIANSK